MKLADMNSLEGVQDVFLPRDMTQSTRHKDPDIPLLRIGMQTYPKLLLLTMPLYTRDPFPEALKKLLRIQNGGVS